MYATVVRAILGFASRDRYGSSGDKHLWPVSVACGNRIRAFFCLAAFVSPLTQVPWYAERAAIV